jgi:hypothetical protein
MVTPKPPLGSKTKFNGMIQFDTGYILGGTEVGSIIIFLYNVQTGVD